MRYCDYTSLEPGMVLAKPIYSDNNELLLARGYALDAPLIERIQRMGLTPICIEEPGTEGVVIDDIVEESLLHDSRNSLKEVFEEVTDVVKNRSAENVDHLSKDLERSGFVAPINEVRRTVSTLLDELLENVVTDWTVLPLKFVKGNHFMHGVDTAILSALIGMHFTFRYDELKHLGLAAILHDLGKSLTPELLDKKLCDLTHEERDLYRKHPEYGSSMLTNHESALYIEKVCIEQHHEQQNGKGFPIGLVGSNQPPRQRNAPAPGEIFRLAEIIHLADAYLNLTTGGWTPQPLSPDEAISEIIKETPTNYNKHIIGALSQIVVRFPKGAEIRIVKNSSQRYVGFHGVVAEPNGQDPHKPLVILFVNRFGEKIKPIQFNMAEEKYAQIQLEV